MAGVAIVTAGYAAHNTRGVRDKWWVNIQSDAGTQAKPIAEWVARSTRPDDVVATDHDLIVYLYAGRRAVPTAKFTALGHITPLTPAPQRRRLGRKVPAAHTFSVLPGTDFWLA